MGRRGARGRLDTAADPDDPRLLRIRRWSAAARHRGRRPMAASDSDLPDRPAARGHAGRDPGRHPSAAPGKRSVRDVPGAVAGHAAVRSGDVGAAGAAHARARGHPSGHAGRLPVRAVPVPVRCGRPMGAAGAGSRRSPGWCCWRRSRSAPTCATSSRSATPPAYWPLLALLAWLVAGERWDGAALVTGLLIVARTTMVSMAPVLMIAVWYRARPRFARTTALLAAAFVLPFLPFAIWDWPALEVRSLRQLSGGDQGLRLDLDRLGAAHDRDHRHAAVARLGPGGRDRAGGHDGRRLRRLRGGDSRRTPPAAVVRVRAVRLQHDDAVAGVVHLPRRLPAVRRPRPRPRSRGRRPRVRRAPGWRCSRWRSPIAGLRAWSDISLRRRRSTPAPTPPAPLLYSGFSSDERAGRRHVRLDQRQPRRDADPAPFPPRRHHRHRLRAAPADRRRRAAAQRLVERHGHRHGHAEGRLAACGTGGAGPGLANRRQRTDAVPVQSRYRRRSSG